MIKHLMQGGAFPDQVARFYFRQLMAAVSHLHSNNICHRDIKPDNILMDDHYSLRLADFGFVGSKSQHEDGQMKTYLGTQGFMAPEIAILREQDGFYDGFLADIFACGVVLFN